MRKFYIHILCAFVIHFSCHAQEIQLANIIQYTQMEGLSSYNIHKILKDKNGFLWIATQDGLNRFEGKEFVVYNQGESVKRRLFSSDIRDLVYDFAQNLLWVICNQSGINGIDIGNGEIKYSIAYNNNSLKAGWRICARQRGDSIYIGTSEGIEIFNSKIKRFEAPGNRVSSFLNENNVNDIRVIDIDPKGNLLLGVMNLGIVVFDPVKNHILDNIGYASLLPNNSGDNFWPVCGTFFSDSLYLLGTKNGLKVLKAGKEGKLVPVIQGGSLAIFLTKEIQHLLYKNNELVISADNLYKQKAGAGLVTIVPDKIDAEPWLQNITYSYSDEQNNLWLGCRQGLVLVKKKAPFLFAVQTNKITGNELGHIYSVCALDQQRILAGTQNGLYEIKDRIHAKRLTNNGLVQNIFRLSGTEILFSGSNGIQLYIDDKILPVKSRYPEFKDYQNWQFNSAVNLNDSIVVIGVESNQGVLIWNKKTKQVKKLSRPGKERSLNSISTAVNTVFLQKNRSVAVLSDYTISILGQDLSQQYTVSIKDNGTGKDLGIYMDMAESGDHYWLAAYGEGLLKLDKQYHLLKKYGIKDGLSNNGVYKIFNYKDSLLVITSNNGLSVFNTRTEKFIVFYENDGIQNNAFEEACGDSYQGKFYAGGVNGFTIIDPTRLLPNITAPPVYISRVLVESKTNKIDSSDLALHKLTIPPDVLQVTLYFSAINWSNPGHTSFAWRITERSKEWKNMGSQNFINLIGLEHGTYHFQVKAGNEDGLWSEPREITLVYLPQWYQTWWFKLLVLLTVASTIFAFYKYRIRQIKKQHAIRKSIATDLHDDLGSTLNSVKVFTNLAISGIKQEESLQQVKENLNEATMGLRDMIWVLDDSLDTVDELVTRLRQYAIPVAAASNLNAVIIAESDVNNRQLSKEEKRNLFLICKEAINNCIKYAGASQVVVNITAAGKRISVRIKDNGKGFNVAEVKKGYGLKNMQYRASQVKYEVLLNSVPGEGTDIEIHPV